MSRNTVGPRHRTKTRARASTRTKARAKDRAREISTATATATVVVAVVRVVRVGCVVGGLCHPQLHQGHRLFPFFDFSKA